MLVLVTMHLLYFYLNSRIAYLLDTTSLTFWERSKVWIESFYEEGPLARTTVASNEYTRRYLHITTISTLASTMRV